MKTYKITTDVVSTTVQSDSADNASCEFADREPMYRGCCTVGDLEEVAYRNGGFARVTEVDECGFPDRVTR